jgi:hypothetical protein
MLIAPTHVRADLMFSLPAGDSDVLRFYQPGGVISSMEIREPANDMADETPVSLAFTLANGFVINRSAVGQSSSFAVLLTTGNEPQALSDLILWTTTGVAGAMQSISVDLDSDPHSLDFGTATLLDTQAEKFTGNDLSNLFFTDAGITAGYGLLAVSDVPEPAEWLPLSTIFLATITTAGVWRKRKMR